MKEREKQTTFSSYVEKHALGTDAGKVLLYVAIGIVVLYGRKYIFNGSAGSIRALKNLKQSIKD